MSRPRTIAAAPFIWAIRAYQATLAPFIGGRCRFYPSCSNYALDAYRHHAPIRASYLTIRRLARCHPLGGSGIDPVPGTEPDHPHKPAFSEKDRDRPDES